MESYLEKFEGSGRERFVLKREKGFSRIEISKETKTGKWGLGSRENMDVKSRATKLFFATNCPHSE